MISSVDTDYKLYYHKHIVKALMERVVLHRSSKRAREGESLVSVGQNEDHSGVAG